MPDFLSMGVSEALVSKLHQSGVVKPTPIQLKAIPFVMDGKDIIAQAQTGTGKTFAFVLPILEKINSKAAHVQALIVTPTRELALQITNEIQKLIVDTEGIDVLAVYGGQDVEKQLKKLKRNIQIVVGTPGRLLDHIRRRTVQLSEINFLVLDEADQMLHIGFLNEVEEIIKETPANRQTMLFSATMPDEIRKLARKHMREPEFIQVEKTQGPADNVKQIAIHTTDRAKQATLIQLVETHRPFLAVIFCRTKRRVSKLYEILKSNGFQCDELHGDLSQAKREQVMKRFRDAKVQLLIATDVAARGLDVEGVTHVFNYDVPLDSESYVHRIGRTGRAGMKGLAITLYSSDDRPTIDMIEKELNITIQKQNLGNMDVETEKSKQRESTKENRGTKQIKSRDSRNRKQHKDSDNRNWGSKEDSSKRRGSARQQDGGSRRPDPKQPRNESVDRGQKRTDSRQPRIESQERGTKRNNSQLSRTESRERGPKQETAKRTETKRPSYQSGRKSTKTAAGSNKRRK